MKDTWFTADTHAWHGNIIGYCNRPWMDSREMTHALADNINDCVPAYGTLYHLGDWSWGNKMWVQGFRDMINCNNIVLVLGNHDKMIRKDRDLQRMFTKVTDIAELNFGKRQKIVMCHYSMRVWNASFHGSWHLYGHSHGTLPEDPASLSFDVGVDCWDYKPVSMDQIADKMKKKEPKWKDATSSRQ